MLNLYDKNTYKNGAYLHDAILTKAEMKYRNSLNSNNSEQLAHHLFGLLTSKGTINEQGVAINNVMRNADEMTKLEFMYLIANSNVSEESIKCSGYYNLFEEFKTKTVEEFGKAKAVMNMIKQTNDLNEIKKLMQDIEDNKYINSMLVNNKENYSSIREYLNEEG